MSNSSTSAGISVAAALTLPAASIACPLPNETELPNVNATRVGYRQARMNEAANEITILFSNDETRRQMAELQKASTISLQNQQKIAEQVRALSERIDTVAATILAVSQQHTDFDESVFRADILGAQLAILHGDAISPEAKTIDELLNEAADIEHFPVDALEIARRNLRSDDVGVRIGSVRVLVLAGSGTDVAMAKSVLEQEVNPFARKMMKSAFEAVSA